MNPPKQTEAVLALVLAIHLSPLQLKKEGGIPLRKEREHDPLVMEPPRTVEGIELVTRGDSKTVVDWINGKAKQKVSYRAIEIRQIQLMEWWKKGVDLCQRIGEWAVHIFRELNKEAELWAGFGTKVISMEWYDESAIDWTKVTGICGFWDGSCNDKVCGANITISFFIQGLGVGYAVQKYGPVEGSNSLDAEPGGCAMLIESLKILLQKAESPEVVKINSIQFNSIQFNSIMFRFYFCTVHLVFQLVYLPSFCTQFAFFVGLPGMGADCDRAPHSILAQRVSCGPGRSGQCSPRVGHACGNRGLSVLSVHD